jgi:predicted dehydrogenase
MRDEVYPHRYGSWDAAIDCVNSRDAPRGGFDIIHIGTPPSAHIPLALEALEEQPRGIIIEKPLCPPTLADADALFERSRGSTSLVFAGYDHIVGQASTRAAELIRLGAVGDVLTLDTEFREHWGGIFEAHPWLAGPQDSYLGYTERGGGASGEHSHALNLWQHFAHVAGLGRVTSVEASLSFVTTPPVEYDAIALLNLHTERGTVGRVVQDVVTRPHRKRAHIQGTTGAVEWVANYDATGDAVILRQPGEPDRVEIMSKSRPDDFIQELQHVERCIERQDRDSPIRLERGLDTMLVLAAAQRSDREGRRIGVEYDRGYTLDALTFHA